MKPLNYRFITIIFIFLVVQATYSQDVIVNEIMSSNKTFIKDCDGDYSDWIELHNMKSYDINLVGFKLSDDANDKNKWTFPNVIIPANGYLLVFASNKDKIHNNEPHTNFKIKQSGEDVVLSDNNGTVLSMINAISIPSDYSYARTADNNSVMQITNIPTPNAQNIISESISCSHNSGFFKQSIKLKLESSNTNSEIRYTLNGSVPNDSSELYISPIVINNNSATAYSISGIPSTPTTGPSRWQYFMWKEPKSVYKCNVVRFASFENGKKKSEIYSKSYFIDPKMQSRYTFPILSLITDSLNLFDYDTGIYIPGLRYDTSSITWWPDGNYRYRGPKWERDIHLTYFKNDGKIAFETYAGARMRGYGSTSYAQKSFNIYFRSEYGQSKIEYPIFKNGKAKKFKRIILRNSGSDNIYSLFRDAMLQDIMSVMNLEKQDYQPSILFINGEYWGIYNIREKYDEHYFKYKYGKDKDSVNILGICGGIEEGNNADYMKVLNFIEHTDISLDANYNHVTDKIDIDNFIDFLITEIYFANFDWPCNNFKIWKDNEPNSKWRFLIYDLDYTISYNKNAIYSVNSMEHATRVESSWPYCGCSSMLFRALLKNKKFEKEFISKFEFHMNTTLRPERIIGIIDKFEKYYTPEIEEHIDRWHYPTSVEQWKSEIDRMKEFAEKRPSFMINDIKEFFDIDEFDYKYFPQNSQELVFYPNPNNGSFKLINNSNRNIGKVKITIMNTMGQMVYFSDDIFVFQSSNNTISTHLNQGLYIVIFEYENKKEMKKMIISEKF